MKIRNKNHKMLLNSLKNKLFAETSIYSLVVARLAFGLLSILECIRQFDRGVIEEYYILPKIHFTYYGFGWISPLSGEGMYWFHCLLIALAIFVTIGLFYRISLALFTIGFTYTFLIDQTTFLNYFYMMILYGILLLFMPANRYFSLDSYFDRRIKTEKISFWPIFLLRAQTEIILFYAGLVKINYDWLVRSQPLKSWLREKETIPQLEYLFAQDWLVMAACYAVVIMHLSSPLLLFKRTRIYIFLIYCCFHTLNSHVFVVGAFPWLTISMTTLFFAPDWPKKIFKFFNKAKDVNNFKPLSNSTQKIAMYLMAFWIISQVLIPLRHYLYPSFVSWSDEGKRFAWRMKLNKFDGATIFIVTDPKTNRRWRVDNEQYLTYGQHVELQCQPDVILQFAHYLQKVWEEEKGYKNVQVNVHAFCSLNKRSMQRYIDPNVDLTKIKRDLKHRDWVTKFDPSW